MNRISDRQEEVIDRMLVFAYPIRVICEVAQVARQTVQTRREPLKYSGAMEFCYCPCGEPVMKVADDGYLYRDDDHSIKPCARRLRRSRLLLRMVRTRRSVCEADERYPSQNGV